jgi:hypothetical protein
LEVQIRVELTSKAEFKSNERSFKVVATIAETLNMKPHDKFKKKF